MSFARIAPSALAVVLSLGAAAFAQQQAPGMGYMHPAGVAAGQTVEVTLGGYDWTPDMQLFTHDPRIKLELVGLPGPVTVPDPPYWFGKKARRGPDPIPREFKAKLTVAADVPPGIYRWQAANANGVTQTGRFVVSSTAATGPEVIEVDGRKTPQELASLPVTVSGQVKKVEEVDRYRFRPTATGLVTCVVSARAFGSVVNTVLEVRDAAGVMVADAADTAGNDMAVTFAAQAGQDYVASVYDLDFRGDRAYTYRLSLSQGPRVATAIPAGGKRGETRPIEFVGYGVATGAPRLESVTKPVAFPSDPQAASFAYRLETPFGVAPPVTLLVGDMTETVEPADPNPAARQLALPAAVTGTLEEQFGEDRYRLSGKKGDVWTLAAIADAIGSPLDVTLAVLDADGKELVRSDDTPGTTDAELTYVVAADGDFVVSVTDVSGRSGTRAATYRLTASVPESGFTISIPDLLALPIGGKASLPLKVTRIGGFKDPIAVTVAGLPAGVTVPDKLTVAAGQAALAIELTGAADGAALASLVTVTGDATIADKPLKRTTNAAVVATTIKPPFSLDAEGMDDVTKWSRGSTFPGPVLIQRDEGWNGEIVLEMHSRQGRVVQGIWGPELAVPPGVNRVLYPIFLPEWLETTRTSRMVVNGVAKIADPKGNVRHVSCKLKTRIGFLPGAALMKLAAGTAEFNAAPGGTITVPLSVSRTNELREPLSLELRCEPEAAAFFSAEPMTLTPEQSSVPYVIAIKPGAPATGEHELTIRATVMQNGTLPVISETKVLVILEGAK